MKKFFLIHLGIFLLIGLTSCTLRQIESELDGLWIVFRIRVNEDPCIYNRHFSDIFMDIGKNGDIEFPAFFQNKQTEMVENKRGQWNCFMDDGKTYLQIKSNDSVFSGAFRMRFLYDPNKKRLFLELTSSDKYILAGRSPINDVEDVYSPTKRNSKENRINAVVRLTEGNFVNYGYLPFDTCVDYNPEPAVLLW